MEGTSGMARLGLDDRATVWASLANDVSEAVSRASEALRMSFANVGMAMVASTARTTTAMISSRRVKPARRFRGLRWREKVMFEDGSLGVALCTEVEVFDTGYGQRSCLPKVVGPLVMPALELGLLPC
jgi:hypothetical protein